MKLTIDYRRNLLSIIGLVLFVILAVASKDTGTTKTTAPSDTNPSAFVTSDELFSAYDQNEVRADEHYKGRYIEVYGRVSKIGKDILDTPYITLHVPQHILNIQCTFSQPVPTWVGDVTPGMSLSLVGKVNGKLGNIQLDDCRAGSVGFQTHSAK